MATFASIGRPATILGLLALALTGSAQVKTVKVADPVQVFVRTKFYVGPTIHGRAVTVSAKEPTLSPEQYRIITAPVLRDLSDQAAMVASEDPSGRTIKLNLIPWMPKPTEYSLEYDVEILDKGQSVPTHKKGKVKLKDGQWVRLLLPTTKKGEPQDIITIQATTVPPEKM